MKPSIKHIGLVLFTAGIVSLNVFSQAALPPAATPAETPPAGLLPVTQLNCEVGAAFPEVSVTDDSRNRVTAKNPTYAISPERAIRIQTGCAAANILLRLAVVSVTDATSRPFTAEGSEFNRFRYTAAEVTVGYRLPVTAFGRLEAGIGMRNSRVYLTSDQHDTAFDRNDLHGVWYIGAGVVLSDVVVGLLHTVRPGKAFGFAAETALAVSVRLEN